MTEPGSLGPGPEAASLIEAVIRSRRSCRHFRDEPVSAEILSRIVEAGIQAPTASNSQNVRFILLTDRAELMQLDSIRYCWPYPSYTRRRETDEPGLIGRSAAVILVLTDTSLSGFADGAEHHIWRESDIQNASAAIQTMLLMATAMGIGTTWISASEAMSHTRLMRGRNWAEALPNYSIASDHHVHGIIILGHPRRVDEGGFPSGEGMHGLDWSTTERQPLEAHLLRHTAISSDGSDHPHATSPPKPSGLLQFQLRLLSTAIRGLLGLVSRLERLVRRLEKPFLTSVRKGEKS